VANCLSAKTCTFEDSGKTSDSFKTLGKLLQSTPFLSTRRLSSFQDYRQQRQSWLCKQELQFVEQLEPRMAAAAGRLQQLLRQGLRQALADGNASARLHCLQAFAAVGDAASAEQVRLIWCREKQTHLERPAASAYRVMRAPHAHCPDRHLLGNLASHDPCLHRQTIQKL
jgi:hypothetical protein